MFAIYDPIGQWLESYEDNIDDWTVRVHKPTKLKIFETKEEAEKVVKELIETYNEMGDTDLGFKVMKVRKVDQQLQSYYEVTT